MLNQGDNVTNRGSEVAGGNFSSGNQLSTINSSTNEANLGDLI